MEADRRKKKKVPGKPTRTVDSVKDERFAHVLKNPVYRPVPKKEKKVEIDKRFQAMFNDEKFKLKYKVDKRGRPVETTTDENLKRYYNLEGDEEEENKDNSESKPEEDSEEDDSAESDIEEDVKEEEIISAGKKSKLKLDELTRKKLHSTEVDYARGEGDILSDESSSDDSSDTDEESFVEHDWGELDKDADRTEESTRRLALCNMDWDRVRAMDLMVLLSSFLPPGGVLKSVTIYPSQFGKERMAEEEVQGPRELLANGGIKPEPVSDSEEEEDNEKEDEEDEDGEGSLYHREKLRQYQLNRLKYFYAVAEFDSVSTAEKVYSECDGMEYESSAAKVDLRFIPDDTSFDEDEPKDQCLQLPDATKYRPRFFTTTALQQVKVDLTWDETDPMRKELTEKIFDPKEKVEDDDIRAYLATSSEDEEESDKEGQEVKNEEDEEEDDPENRETKSKGKEDAISKYKALLMSIESSEKKKKDKEVEMEITWGVGLKENTEKLVKKKLEEEEKAKRTPWQEMLDKQKEKKKQRKQERKRKAPTNEGSGSDSESQEGGDGEDQPFSDDDVEVDMDDDFFRSEMRENDIFKDQSKPKKSKEEKKKKGKKSEENTESKKDAALELLLMDEDDSKRHFSLKKILEEENDSKSKKKRKFKKKRKMDNDEKSTPKPADDFELNVEDNRFSALFTSHHFNVDPSDPNFKKTKAMEKIIIEKQRRRELGGNQGTKDKQNSASKTPDKLEQEPMIKERPELSKNSNSKAELSYLVKSIKRNTESLKSKKSNLKKAK